MLDADGFFPMERNENVDALKGSSEGRLRGEIDLDGLYLGIK